MRRVSGTGSDDDGTDLRRRENVARQRNGDDDTVLPGSVLLQRARSVRLITVRAHGHAGHQTAVMMMMLAASRCGNRNVAVRRVGRIFGFNSHTSIAVMMMMVRMISKVRA